MSNVVPSDKRTSRWNLKYDPERIKQITEAGKPEYLAGMSAANIELEQMEVATKTILNVAAVSAAQSANFLAYARSLWKLTKTYTAGALAREAAGLIARWVARGLDQGVLEEIRFGVFGISAPVVVE